MTGRTSSPPTTPMRNPLKRADRSASAHAFAHARGLSPPALVMSLSFRPDFQTGASERTMSRKSTGRRRPCCDVERGDEHFSGCVRRDDGVDPAARGAIADVGLLEITGARRFAQIVQLLLGELFARALGLPLRELEQCSGSLI